MDTGQRELCFRHVLSWMPILILEIVRKEQGASEDWLTTDIRCEICSVLNLSALRYSSSSDEDKIASPAYGIGLLG